MITNIYLIPETILCPNCKVKIRIARLAEVALNSEHYICPWCGQRRELKEYLNGYVGVIKNVEV